MRKKILGLAAFAFVASLSVGSFVLNTNNVSANTAETATFAMVTGAQVRTADPSGIRFVTDVNEAYKAELSATYPTESYTWVWGTTLTFVDAEQNSWTMDAKTKQWINDDTRWYTALVEIPETDYLTEITAESYVKIYDAENNLVDTKTVENAQTRSIAWTASWALNDGYTDAILSTYTKAIPDTFVEISEESSSVVAGTEIALTATVQPAGYGIAWRSSDTSVATVDKNGVVTAVNAGTATITATLGNATDSYELTVTPSAESKLITSFYYRKAADNLIYHEDFVHTKGVVSENNFAYGSSDLGDGRTNSSAMYMTLSSEYMATLFANAKIAEIKFDIILSVDAKKIAICLGTTEKVILADNKSTSSVELNGVTYYTYTVSITRENYETYGKTSDMTLRYVHLRVDDNTVLGSGSSTFFFIDNLTTVEGEIKLYENKLVTGFSATQWGTDVVLTANNEVNGKTGVYGTSSISNNSATMFITLSNSYMNELFAIDGVSAITFDIILSTGTATIQQNKTANSMDGDYTVSSGETYHTYSLMITKARYEALSGKDLSLRYLWGGKSTFFYVDNLALVMQ